jgi:hypothetical protein
MTLKSQGYTVNKHSDIVSDISKQLHEKVEQQIHLSKHAVIHKFGFLLQYTRI